eukprot:scaffold1471_cov413-Prasinococcus_capsulatus_cf.AAC.10
MQELKLGPNGGLMYCLEYLQENAQWLMDKLAPYVAQQYYVVIDCPGQVELFTLQKAFRSIIHNTIEGGLQVRLTAVHLVDSHLCADPHKYLSAMILSLNVQMQIELPHINVLSKIDLLTKYGTPAFPLQFYTEATNLSYLADHIIHQDSFGPFNQKYAKLTAGLCELIEDFSLLSFAVLDVQNADSMQVVLSTIIGAMEQGRKLTSLYDAHRHCSGW